MITTNHRIMTDNQKYIYEGIYDQIKMGFEPLTETKVRIMECVIDNDFQEDKISEKWVDKKITEVYAEHLTDSKTWQSPTTSQKLTKAFNQLCDMNIIALHFAGYTTSDGEYEVAEVERKLRKKGVKPDGYCFYHEQDLSRAIDGDKPNLYLAFNKCNNNDEALTIEIGKKIVAVLKENGLEVNWEESSTKKIQIINFRWQQIYEKKNEKLLNYKKVIKRILKAQKT